MSAAKPPASSSSTAQEHLAPSSSFSPIVGAAPRVLILGTMPGQRSLADQQYYAHPRNAFWWIMEQAFGVDHSAPYASRVEALLKQPVVLWDVLESCVRPGSLDADIQKESEQPNDIMGLLESTPSITQLLCNGQAAMKLLRRHVQPQLSAEVLARVQLLTLPSTSPAYAALSREAKAAKWLDALDDAGVLSRR